MKVYVAFKGANYDGSWVTGVFADKDAALASARGMAEREIGEFEEVEYESMLLWMESRAYHFYVQEWEVQ